MATKVHVGPHGVGPPGDGMVEAQPPAVKLEGDGRGHGVEGDFFDGLDHGRRLVDWSIGRLVDVGSGIRGFGIWDWAVRADQPINQSTNQPTSPSQTQHLVQALRVDAAAFGHVGRSVPLDPPKWVRVARRNCPCGVRDRSGRQRGEEDGGFAVGFAGQEGEGGRGLGQGLGQGFARPGRDLGWRWI